MPWKQYCQISTDGHICTVACYICPIITQPQHNALQFECEWMDILRLSLSSCVPYLKHHSSNQVKSLRKKEIDAIIFKIHNIVFPHEYSLSDACFLQCNRIFYLKFKQLYWHEQKYVVAKAFYRRFTFHSVCSTLNNNNKNISLYIASFVLFQNQQCITMCNPVRTTLNWLLYSGSTQGARGGQIMKR